MFAEGQYGRTNYPSPQGSGQLILMASARQSRVENKARSQRLSGYTEVDNMTTPNSATVGQEDFGFSSRQTDFTERIQPAPPPLRES